MKKCLLCYAPLIHLCPSPSLAMQRMIQTKRVLNFLTTLIIHKFSQLDLQNLVMIHSRRGGSNQEMYHDEWLGTIDSEPDVISLFLLPLTSLLRSIRGSGFVSHAINLYLRCKQFFYLSCCTNISL